MYSNPLRLSFRVLSPLILCIVPPMLALSADIALHRQGRVSFRRVYGAIYRPVLGSVVVIVFKALNYAPVF
jgi:hypothetical protein